MSTRSINGYVQGFEYSTGIGGWDERRGTLTQQVAAERSDLVKPRRPRVAPICLYSATLKANYPCD